MNLQVPSVRLDEETFFETRIVRPLVARSDDHRLVVNHVARTESWDDYRLTLPEPVTNPQGYAVNESRNAEDSDQHSGAVTEEVRTGHGNVTTAEFGHHRLLLHCNQNELICSSFSANVTDSLPLKTETRSSLNCGLVYQLECSLQEPTGTVVCGVRQQRHFTLCQLERNSTEELRFSHLKTQEYTDENAVYYFGFNPVIKGEYCVLTKNAVEVRSLYGNRNCGTSFSKGDLEPFQCCYGSHPRSILLWQPDGIQRLDMRSGKIESMVSFKRAKWHASYNVQRDEILRCGTMSTVTNTLYGATQKSLFVWDERMGNYPLDRVSHHMEAPPRSVAMTRFGDTLTDFVLLANKELASITAVGIGRPIVKPFGLLTSPAVELELRELPSLRDSLRAHNLDCRGLDDEVQSRYTVPLSGVCYYPTVDGVGIFTSTEQHDIFHQDIQRRGDAAPVSGFTDRWMRLAAESETANSGFKLSVTELYTSNIPKDPRPVDEESTFRVVRTKLPKRLQKFQNVGYYTDEHSTAMVAVWDSNTQQQFQIT